MWSALAPRVAAAVQPNTSSPTSTPVTPAPTWSTVPAASKPVRHGNVAGTASRRAPERTSTFVAVARAVFAADGLDVPIREVARRAGVGPATVYRHFPTKEALLTAAFADEMTLCSDIVEEGLAAADAWDGFAFVVERLLEVHALNRGFSRAFTSRIEGAEHLTSERDRSLRSMVELIRRARDAGALRADFVLEDVILALMANEGIRAGSPAQRAAASRRFAALLLQSFRAHPVAAPLPPPVRLPLSLR